MVLQSVPTNPYLESLVKQNWYKFRGLCLHSTGVILPNHSNDFLTFEIKVSVKIFDPILKCIDFKKKTDANSIPQFPLGIGWSKKKLQLKS